MNSRKKTTRKKSSIKKTAPKKTSRKKATTGKRAEKYVLHTPDIGRIELSEDELGFIEKVGTCLTDALRRHDAQVLDDLTNLVTRFEKIAEKYEQGFITLVNSCAVRTVGVAANIIDVDDDGEPLIEKNFED